MTETNNITRLIIEGIQERKGHKISLIDLTDIPTSAARQFIICEGSSTMQVSSIADSVREYVQEHSGVKPYNYDGYRQSQWIVIDYGDILVHVFLPETRSLYDLEELWSDGAVTEIPDLD